MSDKHIGIGRNVLQYFSIVTTYIIFHKHQDAKELYAFYRYSDTIEIMAVFGQAIDIGSVKTVVMVSCYENFVFLWQGTEPFHKVDTFGFSSCHREVTGMDYHVSCGKILQLTMMVVSVGNVKYLHSCINEAEYSISFTPSFSKSSFVIFIDLKMLL